MHIVISDDHQDCIRHLSCFEKLQGHTVEIFNNSVSGTDALAERYKNADAIVLIRERTVITRELLDRLPKLKVISQTGKMASHVDLQACKEKGIVVMDGRGSGAATAELNMLLILASLRKLVEEVARLKNGQWQGYLGDQLAGKVLGVYGFGRIGKQVCHLGKAFGAKPLVWGRQSSLQKAAEEGFAVASSKEDFFRTSDIVCLQLRLNDETRNIVRTQDLAMMKPTSLLVNASRAELIEPGALEAGLKQGRPAYAAIDTYESEPILGANHPLLHLPNCLCTPHIGFVERDNYEAYFGIAFDNINAYLAGSPQNCVN
ncbi:D-2-hydroxyacid dehydrogenase family protein [Polynucleobacter sp. AP-Latsch-80-C2]|jgi:D-3-phosphoglycerate dehydrogenase|uniref:D-2-hydroxyacid dehydrogenase family protein n=1 Tax=Polynucleobacter sp. AP-Latsch-80-C2 TaxID=2576931 RepID=UPI001C0B4751|nr:D-2-hydroxyacid dehydrogenase family protein [Polynucleobacter sp. AP-Latsch-80-C2]MBU3624021.1 D-2-hydroxyacid dehydrogenase family protein [Polynucleobacter sp. AP-Latsch-80-C2]